MSVVKKKLKSAAPPSAPPRIGLWETLTQDLCNWVFDNVSTELAPAPVDIKDGTLKEMLAIIPETALGYQFGQDADAVQSYVFIKTPLSDIIVQNKVQAASAPKDEAIERTQLDLIMLRPIAKFVMTKICHAQNELDKNISASQSILNKSLSPQGFSFDRSVPSWCLITLSMKAADTSEEIKHAQAEHDILILIAMAAIKDLINNETTNTADHIYNPADPWAIHMRTATKSAPIKLKVVLETMKLTVAECTRLSLGQVIELPGTNLQSVTVETEIRGEPTAISTANLGLYKANRAAQFSEDIHLDFLTNIKAIL